MFYTNSKIGKKRPLNYSKLQINIVFIWLLYSTFILSNIYIFCD